MCSQKQRVFGSTLEEERFIKVYKSFSLLAAFTWIKTYLSVAK